MDTPSENRFEKLRQQVESWGVLLVLFGVVGPAIFHVVSSLNQLPAL